MKFAKFYNRFIQNFFRILKIPRIYIKFAQKWFKIFSKFLIIFKTVQFFKFLLYFLDSFSNFSSYLNKIFIFFHFFKITTNFFPKQGKLCLKSACILLITKISWKFFQQFLKFSLNFSKNYPWLIFLKISQIYQNVLKLVSTSTYIFIKLSNFLKFSES